MNVSSSDVAAGFKEIRVAMMDGSFEIVRVVAPTPEMMAELVSQKVSFKLVFDFVASVTGKDLRFVLEMNPASYSEIFITASQLIGFGQAAQRAGVQAGLKMLESATHHGP